LRIRNRKLLVAGLFLTLVGILLAASFQFIDNHRWYWDIAPLASLVAAISTAVGGLFVAYSLSRTPRRRLWLVALGIVVGFTWIASGTLSASLGFLGMNYFPSGYISWESYSGLYLIGRVNISLLQFATAAGLIACLSVWYGLGPHANVGYLLKAIEGN
jgi:hypothetical protein